MSEPKRMNVYESCITNDVDKEIWHKIPEGEIVYITPSSEYQKNEKWDDLAFHRFNKDNFIGLIYSDIQVSIGDNYYTEFLNDDNRIEEDTPVFIVKCSDIDISTCNTTVEVFNKYISSGKRVEHIAETLSSRKG